jgi:trk system potassium uptake protein TrkH
MFKQSAVQPDSYNCRSLFIFIVSVMAFAYQYIFSGWLQQVFVHKACYWLLFLLITADLIFFLQQQLFDRQRVFSLFINFVFFMLSAVIFVDYIFFNKYIAQITGGLYQITLLRAAALRYILFIERRKEHLYIIRLLKNPIKTMVSGLCILIATGSLLLNMPFVWQAGETPRFIDLLFTAVSAVTLCGMLTVPLTEIFNPAGLVIIIIVVQISALRIIIIAYLIMSFRKVLNIINNSSSSYLLSDSDLESAMRFIKTLFVVVFATEIAAVLILFLGIGYNHGYNGSTFFSAVFHAVMAFSNTSFSLYTINYEYFRDNTLVMLVSIFLIIMGGLGFNVIFDASEQIKKFLYNVLHARYYHKKINLSLSSRITFKYTFLLIFIGFIIFYSLEHNGVLRDLTLKEQYLSALFESVTLRTAGFTVLDTAMLGAATLIFMTIFMFLGASSGGTSGGIKITTFAVAWAGLKSFFNNEEKAEIGFYSVSAYDIRKAYAIILLSFSIIILNVFILSLFSEQNAVKLIFEVVSAFSNTGMSVGIASELPLAGHLQFILLMVIGRIMPFMLIMLSESHTATPYSKVDYPTGQILMG